MRPQSGNSDLVSYRAVSNWFPRAESRERSPAKHLFGFIRASVESFPKTLNPTGPSSTAIQRRGAIQKQQQYTQRLSIQNEGGCRLTARHRAVCNSSYLRTCHWGGCSKINVPRLCWRPSVAMPAGPSLFERRKQEGTWPVLVSLARFCRSEHSLRRRTPQSIGQGTWPQLPINAPDCWLDPTQTGALLSPMSLVCDS